MNEVVEDLVVNYHFKSFKFDNNVNVTDGTLIDGSSSGVGKLDKYRAYLAWINGLLDRYLDLVLENGSSAAQRTYFALLLASHTLQSTSDKQDPARCAAVAAPIHTAVLLRNGELGDYHPQVSWGDEINALTIVHSLPGRVHLSGRFDAVRDKPRDIIYVLRRHEHVSTDTLGHFSEHAVLTARSSSLALRLATFGRAGEVKGVGATSSICTLAAGR